MRAWEIFVEDQEKEIGLDTSQKWLKSLKVLRYDACNLFLEAKDAFQAMWFEEHMRQKVQTKLYNNNKKRIKVHLSVVNAAPQPKKLPAQKKQAADDKRTGFSLSFDALDPQCTYSNFVISEANLLTFKVFEQIAGNAAQKSLSAGAAVNPIYVHGGTGSGKTHLLMATAHALRQQGMHVTYVRAENFTDHVVSAIREGEMSVFRQAYRNSDVLIIDDVHIFSRKGATQEEFFHTFNTLHVAGKPIILSANCAPADLRLIEPRLVSRFEWGIVLSLEMPLRQDAIQILSAKASALKFAMHPKLLDFLLDSFSTAKGWSKALEALVLRSHLGQSGGKHSAGMTVVIAKELLKDLLMEEEQLTVTPSKIIRCTAEHFGIRVEDILGKAKTRDCVLPRQISMHLCRSQLKMPYVKIGTLFSKDHSTVMSSVKLIDSAIEADDPEIAAAYRAIVKKLKEPKTEG